MAEAFVWRTGVIEVADRAPPGALKLSRGSLRRLRDALCPIARHARNGATLLVPGVPEAPSDAAALEAVIAFKARLEERIKRNHRSGRLL